MSPGCQTAAAGQPMRALSRMRTIGWRSDNVASAAAATPSSYAAVWPWLPSLCHDAGRYGYRPPSRAGAFCPRAVGVCRNLQRHATCHTDNTRKVLTPRGEWQTPVLFGVLDDYSRLVCHLQWYWSETAENIAHGVSQAVTTAPRVPPRRLSLASPDGPERPGMPAGPVAP
jgi:hypothetical protein